MSDQDAQEVRYAKLAMTVLAHKLAKEGIDSNLFRELPNIARQIGLERADLEQLAMRVLPEIVSIISGASVVEMVWINKLGEPYHTSRFTKPGHDAEQE